MTIQLHKNRLQHQGFTLVEVMIVVAIVAILAAIAYPSYQNYMRKGWRAEGRAAVAQALLEQERYIMQSGTYKTFSTASPGPFSAYSGSAGSDKAAYSLSASACDSTTDLRECIKITAVPTEAKPDSEVTSMSMDTTNKRLCNGVEGSGVCWE